VDLPAADDKSRKCKTDAVAMRTGDVNTGGFHDVGSKKWKTKNAQR
jgi:hypothetical protein